MGNNELLSMKALKWLKSINYQNLDHDKRMKVIEAARIAYPETNDASEEERFKAALGLC